MSKIYSIEERREERRARARAQRAAGINTAPDVEILATCARAVRALAQRFDVATPNDIVALAEIVRLLESEMPKLTSVTKNVFVRAKKLAPRSLGNTIDIKGNMLPDGESA